MLTEYIILLTLLQNLQKCDGKLSENKRLSLARKLENLVKHPKETENRKMVSSLSLRPISAEEHNPIRKKTQIQLERRFKKGVPRGVETGI